MKPILLILILASLSSCGKNSNLVSSNDVSGRNDLSGTNVAFEGTYDLIEANSQDCAASIQINRECRGFKLTSNVMGPEEFCNVNMGEFTNSTSPVDRVPPPPDRRPPPPPPVNTNSINVTLEGNQLKSVVTITRGIAYTNTLTLNQNRLLKVAHLKSRSHRCLFEKR